MHVSVFVDTSWVVNRAYFARYNLSTVRDGVMVSTDTLYGIVVATRAIRSRYPESTLYFCLDSETNNRRIKYPWYKADRSGSDAWELKPFLLSLIASIPGTVILESDGFEGDDVIATGVRQAPGRKIVFGSDKDLLQLLAVPDTTIVKDMSRDGCVEITAEDVLREWHVEPERMLMLRSILGDPGDSIPRLVPRLRTKVAEQMAALYKDPHVAWRRRDELAEWSKGKVTLTDEMYKQWLDNYDVTELKTVSLRKLMPPVRDLDYWISEWEMRSVAEILKGGKL
jgi:5'-3' exonuclease